MITGSTKRDRERNLEIATAKPNLALIMSELESAQGEINAYLDRNKHASDFWQSRWPGQSVSGRKESPSAFPWENASDVRMRTAKGVVGDHVVFGKTVVRGAKLQARSMRPFAPGHSRRSSQITKLLQWEVGVHMRPNLNREVPLALNWRFGYGAAVLAVGWKSSRRLEFHPLTVPGLAEWIALQEEVREEDFPRLYMEVLAALADPAEEETMAAYVQSLSPQILSRTRARKIVNDLRMLRHTEVPVPYVYQSLPVWTALRPGVDILFPGETDDFQEAPWTARREWVTETTLHDRIELQDYKTNFVEEAIKQKGKGVDSLWTQRTLSERGFSENHFEHLIELVHFDSVVTHHDTPCLYRTVFSPHALRARNGQEDLYATHGPAGYKHGQAPYHELRNDMEERAILSSQGIPEIVYTWEQAIKRQIDGVTDLNDLQLQPPLITPYNRVAALTGTMRPGATLGAGRKGEVEFMPPPRLDGTPAAIVDWLEEMIERRFPIFNEERPVLMQAYQAALAGDLLGEFEGPYDQTFQLIQEFEPEEEVTAVVGPLQRPFQVSRAEIQMQHEISVTFDPRMQDIEYLKEKTQLMLQAMPLNQGGGARTNNMFRSIMEGLDPDAADDFVDDDQTATDRERREEEAALGLMLNGIEPDKPQFANSQLRLDLINEKLAANPKIMARLAQQPDVFELIKNRLEFHQDQIQQFQENPGIGRAVSATTFTNKAPRLTMAGA